MALVHCLLAGHTYVHRMSAHWRCAQKPIWQSSEPHTTSWFTPLSRAKPSFSPSSIPGRQGLAIPMATHEIRTFARQDDVQAADVAAETMALAMSDGVSGDHNYLWCRVKEAFFPYWYCTAINYQLSMASTPLINTIGEGCTCYAYLYPDQKPESDAEGADLEGALDSTPWMRAGSKHVEDDLLAFLGESRELFLQERGAFMYLAFITVRPGHQGRGLGGAMLASVCARADAAGRWCYLEASNPDNMRLYSRFGFEPVGRHKTWSTIARNKDGVEAEYSLTLTIMARPPKS